VQGAGGRPRGQHGPGAGGRSARHLWPTRAGTSCRRRWWPRDASLGIGAWHRGTESASAWLPRDVAAARPGREACAAAKRFHPASPRHARKRAAGGGGGLPNPPLSRLTSTTPRLGRPRAARAHQSHATRQDHPLAALRQSRRRRSIRWPLPVRPSAAGSRTSHPRQRAEREGQYGGHSPPRSAPSDAAAGPAARRRPARTTVEPVAGERVDRGRHDHALVEREIGARDRRGLHVQRVVEAARHIDAREARPQPGRGSRAPHTSAIPM
jgi:hypothetical protein